VDKSPTGPVTVKCPGRPRDQDCAVSSLADARHRGGNTPGLTLHARCLGSEGEGIALLIGDYFFAADG
jgi:hypothetical protein